MIVPGQLAFGAFFAALIGIAALRAHALSRSGTAAAFVVGTLTYGFGGWPFTVVLLAFFVPSVALSRVGRVRKKRLVDIGKSGARDAWQVLANGGVATIFAVLAGVWFGHGFAYAGFAGAYAAATADTWGTEIGTLVRHRPRSIFTLRPMATGLSGGITLPGTLAELAGACWIACIALAMLGVIASGRHIVYDHRIALGLAVAIGGFGGAVVDSVLGATLQELRRCPRCERTCETDPHVCGTPTQLVRGVRGFTNDTVNLAATAAGAVIALASETALSALRL